MDYLYGIIIIVGLYVILATSFNLIIGYGGLVSIAHPVFFALGAYASAILARDFHLPVLLATADPDVDPYATVRLSDGSSVRMCDASYAIWKRHAYGHGGLPSSESLENLDEPKWIECDPTALDTLNWLSAVARRAIGDTKHQPMPPSTRITCPVTKRLSGPARNATTSATSWGMP